MGKPDTGSKKIINIYNQAWAEWVLQQQQVQVEAELSSEFQFIARASDSLLQVNSFQGRFLVLTELQFRPDPKMSERLTAYAALARHTYEQPVYVVVVYFRLPSANTALVDTFYQEFMGQVARQDFRPILLWELEAEQVLAHDNPALLPFVPLMHGGDSEQMVRRCAKRIQQEPQAAELEAILALFASYVLETAIIKQILRWEMEFVQESPLMQELGAVWFEKGIEEGIEKGLEKGREEGARQATLKALRQTLTIRFDPDLEKFDEPFASLDLETLEQLNEVALTVQTLPQFETVLTELLSLAKDSSAE